MMSLGILVTTASSFASHYGDTYGYSSKGLSLGGAMCARVDDWSSVYYNVAGLGKTVHLKNGTNQIALQYQGNFPDFNISIHGVDPYGNPVPYRYSIDDSTGEVHPESTNGDQGLEAGTLVLGLALDAFIFADLPNFISSARLGVGLCVNDDMTVVKVNDLDPRTHNFMRYGKEAQRLTALTAFGMGFFDDTFGFGIGVSSSLEGSGRMIMEEIQIKEEEQYPLGQTLMDMKVKPNLLLGLYVNLSKQIHMGVSFRDESIFNLYPIQSTGITDTGNIPLKMTMAMADYYQPRCYTVGTAFDLGDITLSIDVEFQEWSGFHVSVPAEMNFADDLVEFDDIVIPRVGLEYRANPKMTFMFGYYFQPSFVPDKAVTGILNSLDNDKHVGSLGMTYNLTSIIPLRVHTELCIGYQIQYLAENDVTKTSPTGLNPDYSYGGICHTVMLGLNVSL